MEPDSDPDWHGRPIAPSQLQILTRDDPWHRAYGPLFGLRPPRGLGRSFEDYLAARLAIPLSTLDEVRDFLRRCLYARDAQVHGRREVWVHPEDFERMRAGDCEDHALWAWVQLARMGHDARFTAGRQGRGGHAWVTLYGDDSVRVCESTAKERGGFLLDARDCPDYLPLWSVAPGPRFFWHGPMPTEDAGIVFLDGP